MNFMNYLCNFNELSGFLNRFKLLIPFIGLPLNRGELINPFFIIGSGRSGNTLLRRVLFNHSKLHIPPETLVLGHVIKLFNIHRNMAWKDIVYLIFSLTTIVSKN